MNDRGREFELDLALVANVLHLVQQKKVWRKNKQA
jgi:hypothetical protein